jgi:hypothetical protein
MIIHIDDKGTRQVISNAGYSCSQKKTTPGDDICINSSWGYYSDDGHDKNNTRI